MSEVVTTTEEWKPKYGPWIAAIPTMCAAFMFVLDETIANVALPHMAGTFSVSREESMWILTSYLVASGITVPTVDWFCKLLGRKNFFMLSIMIFTISSFCCGIANSIEMILAARICQGFGGGGLLPISQAILLESFPKDQRGKAMAAFGLVIVMAPIIGPVLGGYITDNWNWPWIFFINIPVGFLTLYISKTLLEDPPYARKQKGVKLDAIGFFFLALWIVSLQIVLDKGNNADWFNASWICKLTAVSVISMIIFIISQIKNKNGLVDLSIFKDKNYSIGTLVQVIIQGVVLASLAILPQFLQSLMGYDAFLSGLSIMPRGVGSFISLALCGQLTNKVNNKILILIGFVLVGTSGLMLGNLNLDISSMNIVIPNFVFGLGMGFAMIPVISLSVMTLRNDQMTNASGVQNLLKNIGGSIGTSLVGTLITRFAQIHQAYLVGNLHPLNPVFEQKLQATWGALSQYTSMDMANYMAQYSLYGEMVKQANLWGFIETFRICGIACFVVIPFIFLLKNMKKENVETNKNT